jgi:uncharacterized protein (DUF1499 family)
MGRSDMIGSGLGEVTSSRRASRAVHNCTPRVGVMATLLAAALLLACAGTPPVSQAPSVADVRALLDEGSTSTVAVTAHNGAEPALRPWRLPAPRAIVQPTLERVIRSMPRWRVAGSGDGVIWAVRRTAVLPFTDDVFLVCAEEGNETVVEVRSAARMGPSDFGRNQRNIVALWTAFQAFMEAHHPPIPDASPDAVS